MHRVIIEFVNPMEAIDLKNQLLVAGLELNRDFVWVYVPATYNNDGFTAVTPKRAVFKFNDPAMATFYQLKWGK